MRFQTKPGKLRPGAEIYSLIHRGKALLLDNRYSKGRRALADIQLKQKRRIKCMTGI